MENINISQITELIKLDNYKTAGEKIKLLEKEKLSKKQKLELLQTKTELYGKTWETEKILEIRTEIDKILESETKIDLSKNPENKNKIPFLTEKNLYDIKVIDLKIEISKKIKLKTSENIFNSLIDRLIENIEDNKSKKTEDLEEKKFIEKTYFDEVEILKELGESGEAFYYKSLYYKLIGDLDTEKKYIEKSALEGNRDSINNHLQNIEEEFLERYNSLKTFDEKKEYKQKKLDDFYKEYFKFIRGGFVNIEGKKISKRNSDLYEDLGLFFENIDEPKKALEEYLNGINSEYNGSYKLYLNITQLYVQNKIPNIEQKRKYEIILKYTKKLIDYSKHLGDKISEIKGLEIKGDIKSIFEKNKDLQEDFFIKLPNYKKLVKDKLSHKYIEDTLEKTSVEYYIDALEIFNKQNLLNSVEDIYTFLRISTKAKIRYSKSELLNIEIFLLQTNLNNYLYLVNYYEETHNYEEAIKTYLSAYQAFKISKENGIKDINNDFENISESFIIFLETKFKELLEKNKNIFLSFLEENENNISKENIANSIEYINQNFHRESLLTDEIIQKIKSKNELANSEVTFLFSNCLDNNFEDNFTFDDFNTYVTGYNNKALYYNNFIQVVLNRLKSSDKINTEFINKILGYIYKQKPITAEFLDDLMLSFGKFDNIEDQLKKQEQNNSKLIKNNPDFINQLSTKVIEKLQERKLTITDEFLGLIFEYTNNKQIRNSLSPIGKNINQTTILGRLIQSEKNSELNIQNLYLEIISFLENKLKNKIRKEYSETIKKLEKDNIDKLELKNIELEKNVYLNELKEIDILIKKIENTKYISDEQIIEIFNYSLDDDYYVNFDLSQLTTFIYTYNYKKNISETLLTNILNTLEFSFGIEDKKVLEPFYSKIQKHEKITKEDIEDLNDIFWPKIKEPA